MNNYRHSICMPLYSCFYHILSMSVILLIFLFLSKSSCLLNSFLCLPCFVSIYINSERERERSEGTTARNEGITIIFIYISIYLYIFLGRAGETDLRKKGAIYICSKGESRRNSGEERRDNKYIYLYIALYMFLERAGEAAVMNEGKNIGTAAIYLSVYLLGS